MKPVLDTIAGKIGKTPPVWMMRQAGRYLPEYRAIREKARDFLHFCYTPEMAIEVTLQPIRRFGFDAAIIFSDILVIPDALGQKVTFVQGEGPRLEALQTPEAFSQLAKSLNEDKLAPVYAALRGVRAQLPGNVTLIGFCGAPWTLATYMIAGRGTPDQAPARMMAYHHPHAFAGLIDQLVEACARHLCLQIEAGAEIIQIFDSWAGSLPSEQFWRWGVEPVQRIIEIVRQQHPNIPIIAFPRGIAGLYAKAAAQMGADVLGLDTTTPLEAVRKDLPSTLVTQGNLDPLVLIAGGEALDRAVEAILAASEGTRHIFNLGHGIQPPTPIAHVEQMLRRIRG